MKYITTIGDKEYTVEVIDERHVSINGRVMTVDFAPVSNQPVYSLLIDGKSHEAYIYPGEENWEVLLRGRLYPAQVEDEREKRLKTAAGGGWPKAASSTCGRPCQGWWWPCPSRRGSPSKKAMCCSFSNR